MVDALVLVHVEDNVQVLVLADMELGVEHNVGVDN
jgi:hypothetical protein